MNPRICMWTTASTNPKTQKPELPTACMERGCMGIFFGNQQPLCDTFIVKPQPKPVAIEPVFVRPSQSL